MCPLRAPARLLAPALLGLALLLAGVGHEQLEHDVAHRRGAHACEHRSSGPLDQEHLCGHGHEAHECLLCLLTGATPPEEGGVALRVHAARAVVARLESAQVARERRPETGRGPPGIG